jgi:hypothetical protein
LVLDVLGLVLVPLLALGVSLRTCFVTLSQHRIVLDEIALGELVVLEVWAAAIPMLAVSIAAATSPTLLIPIWLVPSSSHMTLGETLAGS